MNELMQSPALSIEETRTFAARLAALLAWQTEKYTKGESSSVTVETAQELLASLRYTLAIAAEEMHIPWERLLTEELPPLIRRGQELLQGRLERAKQLWAAAGRTAPGLRNVYYADTLRGIGDYFKRYDLYFFAHMKPPCIDYPLLVAADEALQGLDFTEEYLKRMLTENLILSRFDGGAVRALLRTVHGGIEEAYLNLCEQPLTNELGLALLGKNARSLRMGNAEQEELLYLLQSRTREQRRQLLRGAALKLCGELETGDAWSRGYVTAFAESLLPRLDAALWAGDVSNIFIAAKG